MCVGFTFSFEHNFIQLQLSFLSCIVKHQISCRGLKPHFQHNTIVNCNFCNRSLKLSSFWQQVSPLFFQTPLPHILATPLSTPRESLEGRCWAIPTWTARPRAWKIIYSFLLVLSVYDFLPLWFFSAQPQHHREILRPPRQQSWEGRRRHSQVFWAFWLPAEERFRWKHPLVKKSPLLLVSLMGQTLRESHWATSCRSLAEFELSRKYSQSHLTNGHILSYKLDTYMDPNWILTWNEGPHMV